MPANPSKNPAEEREDRMLELLRKGEPRETFDDMSEKTFEKEVGDNAGAWGLTIPEWKPDWEKIPEDSSIPG